MSTYSLKKSLYGLSVRRRGYVSSCLFRAMLQTIFLRYGKDSVRLEQSFAPKVQNLWLRHTVNLMILMAVPEFCLNWIGLQQNITL